MMLRDEWRQDQLHSNDETTRKESLWATFMNDANSANSKIAKGINLNEMNPAVVMPGGGQTETPRDLAVRREGGGP
jgi:hypothetical protein